MVDLSYILTVSSSKDNVHFLKQTDEQKAYNHTLTKFFLARELTANCTVVKKSPCKDITS